jgi:hypothetical protein
MAAPQKPFAIQRKDDLTFELSSGKIEFIDDTAEVDVTDGTIESPMEEFEL